MPPEPGEPLRARALALRNLAARLDRSGAHQLPGLAGVDTWLGPTPQRCHDDLQALRLGMIRSAEDVRHAAVRLEAAADELDAMTAATASR